MSDNEKEKQKKGTEETPKQLPTNSSLSTGEPATPIHHITGGAAYSTATCPVVQDRWSNVKLMPEVQHRAPRCETSIPVSSSTNKPGRHHTLDGPNGGGTLP
ncbi:hypothetical protein M8J77_025772 [Diaphorina citri]|nr:hypothetical protein M8J77_025772 [Diaphorina citri]